MDRVPVVESGRLDGASLMATNAVTTVAKKVSGGRPQALGFGGFTLVAGALALVNGDLSAAWRQHLPGVLAVAVLVLGFAHLAAGKKGVWQTVVVGFVMWYALGTLWPESVGWITSVIPSGRHR